MPDATCEPVEERMAFVDALEERLESIPGASRVTLASVFPGIGHPRASVAVGGVHDPGAPDLPRSGFARVSPGYFETFLAPLLSGRAFDRGDRAGELPVAIVNAAFERMHLAGDAVGRRVSFPAIDGVEEWHTVVGRGPGLLGSRHRPRASAGGRVRPAGPGLGCILPAISATRVDPNTVLSSE